MANAKPDQQSVADRIASVCQTDSETELKADKLNLQVYRTIREAILSGVLARGELLSSRVIAQALGTSPMPVREALGQLVIEGALESAPNRAFRIPFIDLHQFRQLLLMRLRLETLAAEHAATRATTTDLASIRQHLTRLERDQELSHLGYLSSHRLFHFSIYASANLSLVYASIESLWLRLAPLMNTAGEWADRREEIVHHRALMRAMDSSDAVAARNAVQDDLISAGKRITAYFERLENQ